MSRTITNVSSDSQRLKTVEVLSAAQTLTAADSGKVFILDAAAGKTITLPALAEGLNFKFIVGAAFATDNWVIDSAEGDNINGAISDMGTTVANVPAVGEDQVNFVASAESIGDNIELIADYANSQWLLSGRCAINGGITVTDPS
jgi:hypothetical protein